MTRRLIRRMLHGTALVGLAIAFGTPFLLMGLGAIQATMNKSCLTLTWGKLISESLARKQLGAASTQRPTCGPAPFVRSTTIQPRAHSIALASSSVRCVSNQRAPRQSPPLVRSFLWRRHRLHPLEPRRRSTRGPLASQCAHTGPSATARTRSTSLIMTIRLVTNCSSRSPPPPPPSLQETSSLMVGK
jgi:hypothetical protein